MIFSTLYRRHYSIKNPNSVLVTGKKQYNPILDNLNFLGALGQLGSSLIPYLSERLPTGSRIIGTDIRKKPSILFNAPNTPYFYADVLCQTQLEKLVIENNVDTIIHFSALLSAIGELHPDKALRVNLDSVHNILRIAKEHHCKVIIPSTIGAFGPSSPKILTPDITIMRPTTIYGITKLHMELMGEWYHRQYGVDFRSIRLPGVLSFDQAPGGGTTDYAIHMILAAVKKESVPFTSFLSENTRLPMMHIQDTLRAFHDLMIAAPKDMKQRVYNIHSMDFTPKELENSIRSIVPDFPPVRYIPDHRQAIADSWPSSLDDFAARQISRDRL